MAQITRKDVENYRNDEEERAARRIAEQRRQKEALLQHIRNEATELGRRLESIPKWMQAIEELRSEVLHALAADTLQRVKTVTTTILLSDMPWWWRRKWNRLADGCRSSNAASSVLEKGLLEGGLKNCLETILPLNRVYCHGTRSAKWEIVVEFLPPKG